MKDRVPEKRARAIEQRKNARRENRYIERQTDRQDIERERIFMKENDLADKENVLSLSVNSLMYFRFKLSAYCMLFISVSSLLTSINASLSLAHPLSLSASVSHSLFH